MLEHDDRKKCQHIIGYNRSRIIYASGDLADDCRLANHKDNPTSWSYCPLCGCRFPWFPRGYESKWQEMMKLE